MSFSWFSGIVSALAAWGTMSLSSLAAKDPVDYIDPFIGAGSTRATAQETARLKLDARSKAFRGKTFPGAATPGGMVQLSPDTITGGDNGSGYSYPHTTIQGFSVNHLSGVGAYGDLGNFLVMPTTGPLKTYYGKTDQPGSGYLSLYSKGSEAASAGYYAVTLDDYQVRAELTAAPHCGVLRFTFPKNEQSRIQIDLARRIGGVSLRQTVKVVNDHAIEGLIDCPREGGGWLHGKVRYTLYYHAEFSKPLANVGVWSATLPPGPYRDVLKKPAYIEACQNATVLPGCREQAGQHLGFYTEFPTESDEIVMVKVGISYVSADGARENLAAEVPDWDFDRVHRQARDTWAKALSRMQMESSDEAHKTTFYTALYHALLDPRIQEDVNGYYPGGDGHPHLANGFTKRTIFSGWDVYRSEFPLLTLIAPEIVNDTINSQVALAEENGTHYFDRWELMNCYTGCMNGNPNVAVISDAYLKGIRHYNVDKAYQYSVNMCQRFGNTKLGYTATSLSSTTEHGLHDWNLAQWAAAMGKAEDAQKFGARSMAYKLLFDPEQAWTYDKDGKDSRPEWKGWFRPKGIDGRFLPWEGLTSGKGVTEATVYQQGWFAPHDVPGLIELLGGRELFIAKLTDFFERTPNFADWNAYYNHPNEPCHLVAFLFNRAAAPWLTQKWVRRICTDAYTARTNGLCGDEDVGQMSAWYLLAASGLHQACPGDLRFEIFSPQVDKVTIQLDPKYAQGTNFVVEAINNSPQNIYVQSAKLNGAPLNRCWLDYKEISAGGKLELVLGPEPNKGWGVE